MKKLVLLLVCGFVLANQAMFRLEKNNQYWHGNITSAQFGAVCKKTVKTIVNNNMYLVDRRKSSSDAYYYGCDGTGRTKVVIELKYDKDKNLNVSYNMLLEGDFAPTEAAKIADELTASLNATFEKL